MLRVWNGLTAQGLGLRRRLGGSKGRDEMLRLRQLADAAVDGLVVCRDGEILLTNKSFDALAGRAGGALEGGRFDQLFEEAIAPSEIPAGGMTAHTRSAEGERTSSSSTQSLARQGAGHVGVAVRDLRDRVAAEAHIRFPAHHDPLTRLPNRLHIQRAAGAGNPTPPPRGRAQYKISE